MKKTILEQIQNDTPLTEIIAYAQSAEERVSLFTPVAELNEQNLYDYFQSNKTFHGVELRKLIRTNLIDFSELDENGKSLMQRVIEDKDLYHFSHLLLAKQKPTTALYEQSQGSQIGNFLRYHPGKKAPSTFEDLNSGQLNENKKILDQLHDFLETTDEESSEADLNDGIELSKAALEEYRQNKQTVVANYNVTQTGAEKLSLIASRGMHFVPKYFPKPLREKVKTTKKLSHTTYSLSTLIDSGYSADEEPHENDEQMLETHRRNLSFIKTLKGSPDKKEKRLKNSAPSVERSKESKSSDDIRKCLDFSEGSNTTSPHTSPQKKRQDLKPSPGKKVVKDRAPPASRNKRVFDNLFWRHIQVYINSYSTLFNLGGIKEIFGFHSTNNPHLSLSWKTEKAGMYGSGKRFSPDLRRDPHYRRYDGKAKHPNMGYIDVYEFPLEYVRTNGVDRLLAYNSKKIDLSSLYLAEAEIIFHSMIPQVFHKGRYIISLPSLDDDKSLGTTKKSILNARLSFFDAVGQKEKKEAYHDWVSTRMEKAVEIQARVIDKTIDAQLFTAGKVRVYDLGGSVSTELPTPNRSR